MKKNSFVAVALLVLPFVIATCKKESDDNASKAAKTTTTSTTSTTTSNDQLTFGSIEMIQFSVEKKVAGGNFLLKATHITGDPVCNIFLFDSIMPSSGQTYSVINRLRTSLSAHKCAITITYNGTFYNGYGGNLKLDLSGEQAVFSFDTIPFGNMIFASGKFYADKE